LPSWQANSSMGPAVRRSGISPRPGAGIGGGIVDFELVAQFVGAAAGEALGDLAVAAHEQAAGRVPLGLGLEAGGDHHQGGALPMAG
jgi:hypothetical protein